MKIKKKIIGICLVLTLFLTMLPMSVVAAASGRIEGVDYSRILTAKESYDLTLTLGDLRFPGALTRSATISEEEQDKIIREVMTTWPKNDERLPQSGDEAGYLTSAVLQNLDLIATAEQLKIDRPRETVSTIVSGIMDAVSNYTPETGPAGDIALTTVKNFYVKVIEAAITGKIPTSAAEIEAISSDDLLGFAADIVKNTSADLVDSQGIEAGVKYLLKKAGKSTGWVKHAFAVKDLLMTGIDVKLKRAQMQELINKGADRAGLLNDFYLHCNNRIAEKAGDNGDWKITFSGLQGTGVTDIHYFNMWGIDNLIADWTLTGELTRQITGAGDQYGGTYKGGLYLEVNGSDMKNSFDARFMENDKTYNLFKFEFAQRNITSKDTYKTTILKRSMSGEFTVYIQDGGTGEFSPTVLGSFTSGGDEIEFSFDHNIGGEGHFSTLPMKTELIYKSTDLYSYNFSPYDWVMSGTEYEISDDYNGTTNTIEQDPGTVWQPLESEPAITINLK